MGVDRSKQATLPGSSWADRRVLVTGSAGFIGHHIAASLRAHDACVHEIRGRLDCDLRDADATRARIAASAPEVVIHLAANPDQPDQIRADETVAMTANLLDALEPFPGCLVIHTGSYKQYGRSPLPFREANPARPDTAYGHAKHRSECMILEASAAGRVRGVGLRIGPVYGPQQYPDTLISTLMRHALSTGDGVLRLASRPWDPVYVTDVADAILRAGDLPHVWGRPINISGGVPYLPVEVLAMVVDVVGCSAPEYVMRDESFDESQVSHGDIGLAAEILGWRPTVPLRLGLQWVLDEHLRDLVSSPLVQGPFDSP